MELLLGAGLLLTMGLTALNGLHDASNANALPVRFNVLTPKVAVGMGAICNVAGALTVGLVLTQLIPTDITVPHGPVGMVVLISAMVATIGWGLLTWWWALPTSSTAALSGGLIGALWGAHAVGLASGTLDWGASLWRLVVPVLVAPAAAFVLAQLLVFVAIHLVRHQSPRLVKSRAGLVQATGAAVIHFGHGLQHGRHSLWLFTVLLACHGTGVPATGVPLWIPLLLGVCLGAGTLGGGWRIAYTLSSRVVGLDSLRGAAAQAVAGTLLFVGGFLVPLPMSTSQTSTAAILGAGSLQRFRTVYHATLVRILAVWVVTVPVCAAVAATLFLAVSPLLSPGR